MCLAADETTAIYCNYGKAAAVRIDSSQGCCVPVVVLNCISQPVADQLLEHFEGRPEALGIEG